MPRNVEIKARVADMAALTERVAARADSGPEILLQEDVFFAARHGRLKLRKLGDGNAELIFYERPDAPGPSESRFIKTAAPDPAGLEEALGAALGRGLVVRKERHLYLIGRTRVHLDRVEGLGDFVELEVVLGPGESAAAGRRVAEDLMSSLVIDPDALVKRAYADLLQSGGDGADRTDSIRAT